MIKIKDLQNGQIYNSFKEVINAYPNENITVCELTRHLRGDRKQINGLQFERLQGYNGYKRCKIVCIETGEIFKNASELADSLGVHRSVVTNYFKRAGNTLMNCNYVKIEE